MAVVRNLMIRIGADYSAARQAMQGATRELSRFKRETTKATSEISGRKGLGGISDEMKNMGSTVASSFSRLRGIQGIGGVVSELKTLTPALRAGISGLQSLGAAAGGAAAALGPIGIGLAAITAALAALTSGLYYASQGAVKFEADIGRLNMQLKGNSREFMDWAKSVGLARSTAAEMGSTYSTLLSSFISDNEELSRQTKDLVQATRVVASWTGREISDVMERIRSGLLGNTEAIEDLGIFVNVSMIETTEAFKRFANGKHWDQLDFRVQQQIRLAAILEQAYARYGNNLQQNVMTKQTLLIEQLKDIRLNLSQAFLPIWDAVLPALIRLAEEIAYVTEQIARFVYWLRGWDYDEMTRGTDRHTDAINDQGKSYDDLADSAKAARKELAAFDEINQLGDFNGGPSGGTGGGTTGITPPQTNLPDKEKIGGLKQALEELKGPWWIEFLPPIPPDAGIGAVATAVISTINELSAQTVQKMQEMWNRLREQTETGKFAQETNWRGLVDSLGGFILPELATAVGTQWSRMMDGVENRTLSGVQTVGFNWSGLWNTLRSLNLTGRQTMVSTWSGMWDQIGYLNNTGRQTAFATWSEMFNVIQAMNLAFRTNLESNQAAMWETLKARTVSGKAYLETQWNNLTNAVKTKIADARAKVTADWQATLDFMQSKLNAYRPYLEWGWALIGKYVADTKIPLMETKNNWQLTLEDMRNRLFAYIPELHAGWALIGASVLSVIPTMETVKSAWSNALQHMLNAIRAKASDMIAQINAVLNAWMAMMAAISGGPAPVIPRIPTPAPTPIPAPAPAPTMDTGRPWVDNAPVLGDVYRFLDWVRQNVSEPLKPITEPILIPGAGAGSAVGIGSAAAGKLSQWLKNLGDLLKGSGVAIPQLASGGIVTGPTLAMIGEAGTEAVIPLEDSNFINELASAVGTAVAAAIQVSQTGQTGQSGDIVIQIDGTTLARILNPLLARENQRIGSTIIQTV